MKKTLAQMQAQGMEFKSVLIGTPKSIAKIGGDTLLALVPQSAFHGFEGRTMKSDSHLLGISEDAGENWVFIDLSNLTADQFEEAFPELAPHFEFPPKKQPFFMD